MADNRAAPISWRSVGQEYKVRALGTRHAGCPCRASGIVRPLMEGLRQQWGGRGRGFRQVSGHGKVDLKCGNRRVSGPSPVTPASVGEAGKVHR